MKNPHSAGRASPVRVAFVTDDLGGGTGNHILSMLRHWDRSRWDAAIISQAPLTARVTPDVEIRYLARPRWLARYPFAQAGSLFRVYGSLRENPPDIVHAYFFWPIVYARILKSLGVVRTLVENREDEGFNWGTHEYLLLGMTRSLPDRVICVSEAVRRVVLARERLDGRRVVVIRNGVEPADPGAARDEAAVRWELNLDGRHLVVGMVANFNRPVKGVDRFLSAAPGILAAVPSARFLILGRGKDEPFLRRQAMDLGIGHAVLFAGFRKDIDRFYGIMDVSVLTSSSEGLSITLLESMSHGVPVVATRVGGNPEVVADGETGYLVPAGDTGAFVDRVVRILRDPELKKRMGREGRRRIEERFLIRDVARRYIECYESLRRKDS